MQHMNIGRTKEERKVNMKRKVINVSYRKDSNTFEDWMKYEIEILNEDGTTEKIPAYVRTFKMHFVEWYMMRR